MAESEDIIIEKMLDKFQVYWFADFSKLVSGDSWGDREAAKKYLTKYWLPEDEYLNYWRPIQDKIFIGEHEFYPFDIYGVQNEHYDLFQEEFGLQDEEYEEVLNLLPDNCKQTY